MPQVVTSLASPAAGARSAPARALAASALLWSAASCAGAPAERELGFVGAGAVMSMSVTEPSGASWSVHVGPEDIVLERGQSRAVLQGLVAGRATRFDYEPGDPAAWTFWVDGRDELYWRGAELRFGERRYTLGDPGVVILGTDGALRATSANAPGGR